MKTLGTFLTYLRTVLASQLPNIHHSSTVLSHVVHYQTNYDSDRL